jgi:hypothetical protein
LKSIFVLSFVFVSSTLEVVVVGSPLDLYLHSLLDDNADEEDGSPHNDPVHERERRDRSAISDVINASYLVDGEEAKSEDKVKKKEEDEECMGLSVGDDSVSDVLDDLWSNFLDISTESERIFGILTSPSPPSQGLPLSLYFSSSLFSCQCLFSFNR